MSVDQQRRKINVSLFVSLIFLWGSFEAQPVFIDALLGALGWDHERVSWIAAVTSLGIGIIGPLAGWLLDRHDARYVMATGAILVGTGALASAACNTLGAFIAATLVYGVGLGASTVLPSSLVIANWHGQKRGRALGFTLTGMEVGGMLLTFASGAVIAIFGWRAGYILIGLPAILIAAPLLYINVRTRPTPSVEDTHKCKLPGFEWREAIGTLTFWTLMVAQIGSGILIGGVFPFLVAYFHSFGFSLQMAALLVTGTYGCVIVGKPLLGMLGDVIGSKNALAAGFIAWSVAAVGLMLGSRLWSPILFLGAIGFALPTAIANVPAVLAQSFGLRRFGSLYGTLAVGNTLGLTLGPLLTGVLIDRNGSYPQSFAYCLPIAVVCAIAGVMSGKPQPIAVVKAAV